MKGPGKAVLILAFTVLSATAWAKVNINTATQAELESLPGIGAVKAERIRQAAWPAIPRDTEWKHGVCNAFGWPHENQAHIAKAWQFILSRANSYADLEPAFLGRVEELIDFVTAPGQVDVCV